MAFPLNPSLGDLHTELGVQFIRDSDGWIALGVPGPTGDITLTDPQTGRAWLNVAERQASTTDATAGRGMTVGAFGLGGAKIEFAGNIDDVSIPSGQYHVQAGATGTKPAGLTSLSLDVIRRGGNANTVQVAYGGGRIFNREFGTVWSAWRPGVTTLTLSDDIAALTDIISADGAFRSQSTKTAFFSNGIDPAPQHRLPGRVFAGASFDFAGATSGNNQSTGSWVHTGDEATDNWPGGTRLQWVETQAVFAAANNAAGSGAIAITGSGISNNASKSGFGLVGIGRMGTTVDATGQARGAYLEIVRGAGTAGKGSAWGLEIGAYNFAGDPGANGVTPAIFGSPGFTKGIKISSGDDTGLAFPIDVGIQLTGARAGGEGARMHAGIVFHKDTLIADGIPGLPALGRAMMMGATQALLWDNSSDARSAAVWGDGAGNLRLFSLADVALFAGGDVQVLVARASGATRFIPRSTAPTSPARGDTYYDNTLEKLRTWNGAAWQNHW